MSTLTHKSPIYFGRTLSFLVRRLRAKKILLLCLIRNRQLRTNPIEESVSLFWRDAELERRYLLILWLFQTMMDVCGLPIFPVLIQVEPQQDNKTHPYDLVSKSLTNRERRKIKFWEPRSKQ